MTTSLECHEVIQHINDKTDHEESIPISCGLHWHRQCYSEFTHKVKIERLKEKQQYNANSKRRKSTESEAGLAASTSTVGTGKTCRRIVPQVDWSLCMFCQQLKPREALISVTTFNVSTSILEKSYLDNTIRVRLAGVSNLMAAEGKYHKRCLSAYQYHTGKNKEKSKNTDIALIFLCSKLRYAAKSNQILQLSDVWTRYMELAEETNIEIPQSFISRRSSFKEKLM